MSADGSERAARAQTPKVSGTGKLSPEPSPTSGPEPPQSRDPPLTIQFKIAKGDQILFESTPTEIPSQDLSNLLKLASPSEPVLSSLSALPSARYALRKGFGFWHLIFDGQETILKHERGIFYVIWLFTHPGEYIHALDLAAKIPEIYRRQLGLMQIADPTTGKSAALQSDARIQERSLALDDAQAMRSILRKEKELEAILDDEAASEPEKAEALRELEAIAQFQRQHGQRSQDSARRVTRTIRMAIYRLHARLAAATDFHGRPHPAFRSFAQHIKEHLIIPSARYSGHGNRHARSGLAGSFTYEPPPGLEWADCRWRL